MYGTSGTVVQIRLHLGGLPPVADFPYARNGRDEHVVYSSLCTGNVNDSSSAKWCTHVGLTTAVAATAPVLQAYVHVIQQTVILALDLSSVTSAGIWYKVPLRDAVTLESRGGGI